MPLNKLFKKRCTVELVPQVAQFLENINMLTPKLLLTHFNPDLEITVTSDPCDCGIGSVIFQKFNDVRIKAAAHASRMLMTAETNPRCSPGG